MERRQLAASLPKRRRPKIAKIHLPLLREMSAAASHEDAHPLDNMIPWFPVMGAMHTAGVGRH